MRGGRTYHSGVGSASNLYQSFVCESIMACLRIDDSGFAESKKLHDASCRRMSTVLQDFRFHGQASKDRHHPRLFYLDNLSWQRPLDMEVDQGRVTACWFQEREHLHIVASIGAIVSSEGSRPGNLHAQQQSRCKEQSGNGPWQVQPQRYMIGPLSPHEHSGPRCFPGEVPLVPWEHLAPPSGTAPLPAPPLLGGPH